MKMQSCFPKLPSSKKVLEDIQIEAEIELILNDQNMTDQEKQKAIEKLLNKKLQRDLLERIIVY